MSAWAKQTFTMAWLFQGNAELRAGCLDNNSSINQAIPWIQDSLLRMLCIRQVYTFELGEDRLSFACGAEPIHHEFDFSTEAE